MNNHQHNTGDPRVIAGMAAQARTRAELLGGGARSTGWKAGLGAAAAMEKVGTDAPVTGFLTSATLVAEGGRVSLDGWAKPTFEPELAVRVDRDVPGAATAEVVRAAIGAVAPAIELVDLNPPAPPDDLEAVLAGNIFHRAYAVGPWTSVAVDEARLRVLVDDEVRADGVDPSVVLGDLVAVVRAIAAQAALTGAGLRAGELVITGSAIPAIALAGAATLTVALEGTDSAVSLTVG
jgi:2-keto-4-pentenoate hydratase